VWVANRSFQTYSASAATRKKQGKQFFFEKKNQKTFDSAVAPFRREPRQPDKSFLLLFLEKEGLSRFR
jgi:hypothetical protein